VQETLPRADVCRRRLAPVTSLDKGGMQLRRTKDQCWRSWNEAMDELNRREHTRIGVIILSRIETETATVEPTWSSIFTLECGLSGQRQIRWRVRHRLQTRAMQRMETRGDYGRPATAPYIKGERRREASDGNDAVRDWENQIYQLNSCDRFQQGMSLCRSNTPTSSDEERRIKTTTCSS